jgi:hypothetical protein
MIGPLTELESHYLCPKVADEEGPKVPVLVRDLSGLN